MNVGIFAGDIRENAGGGFTFQETLINALEQIETDHQIFVFHYGKRERAVVGKVKYISLFHANLLSGLVAKGKNVISGKPYSLLHQAVDDHHIDMMWFVSLQFVHLDIPYICTVWDLEHRAHPFFPEVSAAGTWQFMEQLFSTMIPRAAFTICGTEAGRQQIIDFYHPDAARVRVIPFPSPTFTPEEMGGISKHGSSKPYLFYPAQFWPHKNHVAILLAQKLLIEQLDYDVVFCGADKGNLAYVQEKARELGLEGRVHFLGFVTRQELYTLYRDAFALVYPSTFGPDNLPPLEAFAVGCPVIAARVSGAVEQLGDAALLFDPCSEQEIAAAVLRLHNEPHLKAHLVAQGKERAGSWSPRDYVDKILELYDEFAGYRRCWSSKTRYVDLG